MDEPRVQLNIHRPGKPVQITGGDLISENKTRLCTFRRLSGDNLERFRAIWVNAGLLLPDCGLTAVRKTLFFRQKFQVMELLDAAGIRLGIYCDISSPLIKDSETNQYHYTDWFLDVWLAMDGSYQVLDEDEFEQAYQEGWLSHTEYLEARASLVFLLNEIENGRFPDLWIRE
jgi:predicted RNA-binding protein associated with RNAse of E/G family